MGRRKDDPRRSPEAAEQAREKAVRRHDEHVIHRAEQDLADAEQEVEQ